MRTALQHLWREVIQGPTKGLSLGLRIYCPTKISYLYSIPCYQYIFRFDISMDDIIGMQIRQSLANLFDYFRHLQLVKRAQSFHNTEKFTLRCILQNQGESSGTGEVAIEFDDVGMIEGRLYDHFSLDLFDIVIFCEFVFAHDLDGHYEVRCFFFCAIDYAEFASADSVQQFEIIQRPLFLGGGLVV